MFTRRTRTKRQLTSTTKKKVKFHKYQNKGIKFLIANLFTGLLWAPGLGKTITVLEAFKRLKKKGEVDYLIIFAKLRICYSVWPKEIDKWGYDFNYKILHGKNKEADFNEEADVYLVNYDGVEWFKDMCFKHGLGGRVWLVFDESSKVKSTRTVRFKTFKKILHLFDRRTILTGSPVPNGMQDIFGQVYVLDKGAALGQYITQFRNRYFYPSGYMGYEYKLQDGAEELIYERIRPLVLRYGHDLLDMPPLVPVYHEFDLPDKVQKVYNDLEKEFVAELKNGHVQASTAGVVSGMLRQITNGGIYHDKKVWSADAIENAEGTLSKSDLAKLKSTKLGNKLFATGNLKRTKGRTWELLHNEKTEILAELVEELNGDPCLVAYEFNHDLERLLEAFPDTPYIGGGVTPKESTKIEDDWNAGRLPLLFGQPSTIAHGLNLQESGWNIFYYGLIWNLEDYEQLIMRLWRQGQKNKVIVHHAIARNTVDEVIMQALKAKDRTQQSFLKAMEENYDVKIRRGK